MPIHSDERSLDVSHHPSQQGRLIFYSVPERYLHGSCVTASGAKLPQTAGILTAMAAPGGSLGTPTLPAPAITLDPFQSAEVTTLFGGRNVALVGPARSGKSAVLRAVVKEGKQLYEPAGVLVLSWTGSAAIMIQGRTLAYILRTSVGDPSKKRILCRVVGDRALSAELRSTKLIVIDEAPTLQGRWMDGLEFLMRLTAPSLVAECLPFGCRDVLGKFRSVVIICFMLKALHLLLPVPPPR